MSKICKNCSHWACQDWDPLNHECFLEHGPASGVGDGGYTDASDCPDYDGPEKPNTGRFLINTYSVEAVPGRFNSWY